MCKEINELTWSVCNITPLLKGQRLRWPKYSGTEVAKVEMHKVTHLLYGVHLDSERGILPTWQGRLSNSVQAPR